MKPQPPSSTYRVQLSSHFTLDDLARHVPYLAALGISDVYLSPVYAAKPGSPHGYDIVDHATINPQLGGDDGWRRLSQVLREHSLGVILDVVPNHMAADPVHNALWRQVLGEGPSSPAARYFDVDWRPLTGLIQDKVLLPVLEEPYGAALLQDRVRLERADGEIRIRYGSLHLPLARGTFDPAATDEALAGINADPQRIHAVLEAQHYRLAYWRAANDEINYRRFFDVNELIAIRTEDEGVFKGSHELVLRLVGEGAVSGLRIDHVDGLLDPTAYLQRLRAATIESSPRPIWIVVEKILDRSETLDPEWPVQGTTGYDALNVLNRLFISGRGVRALRRFYQKFAGHRPTFQDVAHESKRLVMERTLRSGFTIMSHALKRVADASWTTRDITLNALSDALVEFVACLPVYRTYLRNGGDRPADRDAIEQSFARAIRRTPSLDLSALTFLRSLQLDPAGDEPALAELRRAVVHRLQQYTSGVHAKGIEDTAFYRDNTLLALNEVGGDPGGASGTLEEFHRFNERRWRQWPDAQTPTSTHDTKLGEDARIRIATLSTCTAEWIVAVQSWSQANARFRQAEPRGPGLDPNDEYRLYQALIGVWPADDCAGGEPAHPELVERVASYMRKAIREAQVHTSWIRVNEEYEGMVEGFVRALLTSDAAEDFRRSLREIVGRVLPISVCHSISQLVLKCLMPGVPDIYQGGESWGLFLTDPDNRQPVDFEKLQGALAEFLRDDRSPARLQATSPHEVLSCNLKHYVANRLLRFRRDRRELMSRGRYAPVRARGDRASAVVAFRRTLAREHLVVAVPRLVGRPVKTREWPTAAAFWGDTELRVPAQVREWTNLLSGETLSLEPVGRALVAGLTLSWPWIVLYGRQ